MKNIPKSLQFPKDFYFGASTSAHQIEGELHNNWTVWELENARSLAAAAKHRLGHLPIWKDISKYAENPDNYVSGVSIDHRSRYKLDLAIAKKMNLNAFRFSIEWSRIEPKEGVWDPEAINYYRQYIAEIKKCGMEPFVTLYHWTVPTWFQDIGGFEKKKNIRYFERFAARVIDEFRKDLRYITTINEPDTVVTHGYILLEHPPQVRSYRKAFLVYRNLLIAHKRVHRYVHKNYNGAQVGFTKSYAHVWAGDDRWFTKMAVRADYYFRDTLILRYVMRRVDFIGVNCYFSDRRIGLRIENNDDKTNDLGWGLHPDGLQHVLIRLSKWKRPIVVMESGVADMHDEHRKEWIAKSLAAIAAARQKGVDVRGYLHWSFIDNFEWAFGRWPRFGLVAVDYENDLKRTVRPSGVWYANLIKKIRGIS